MGLGGQEGRRQVTHLEGVGKGLLVVWPARELGWICALPIVGLS